MVNFEVLREKIKNLGTCENSTQYLKEFLLLFNIPKATIARLQIDDNLETDVGIEISNKLFFTYTLNENLFVQFEKIQRTVSKHGQKRILMLMNDDEILALDTFTDDWLSISRKDLYKKFEFFLPLMGKEKTSIKSRESVSVEIGSKFAQFYNEMYMLNPKKEKEINDLIVCLVCGYLSEAFDFIEKGKLESWISLYSKSDGSNLGYLLDSIFNALTSENTIAPEYIKTAIKINIKNLNYNIKNLFYDKSTRELLINLSRFDWSEVEPEVLGSLIQNIILPSTEVSYNYTSTANIYKVIGPLFMEHLHSEFDKLRNEKNMDAYLLERLSNIKVFDPSCGTGNFLMVAYKELKKFEKILKEWLKKNGIHYKDKEYVNVNQFFGIEENSFATVISQIGITFIDVKYNEGIKVQKTIELPCKNIVTGIASDIDWEKFCPVDQAEVYIVGNPSYKGYRGQSDIQRKRMREVFHYEMSKGMKIGDLDYASIYFYLAAKYIKNSAGGFAFVTTNSLTQGVHVPNLWPVIFNQNISIFFGHSSFKWFNEGRNNTAVTVVVIGCRPAFHKYDKKIFSNNLVYDTKSISPYLTKGNVIVYKESKGPISKQLPRMVKGNMPYGKDLLLSPKEKEEIIEIYPEASDYLKRVVGSQEFIRGQERWCLWILDENLKQAMSVPLIADRIERVKEARLKGDASAKRLAERPHQFREMNVPQKYTLVIPSVSSENRDYFQVGFVDKNTIVTNLCFTIYDAEPWVFGIIASTMHNLWVRTVCGGLETRPRYSNVLGYNTFPLPNLSKEQKLNITNAVYNIIRERESKSELSLMELYNRDSMPAGLKYAHNTLDIVVESCYKKEGFYSNQERLDEMFLLYQELKGV